MQFLTLSFSFRHHLIRSIALMAGLLSGVCRASSEPGPLNLRQLIAMAQRDNKDLQVARYGVQIGQARLLQAGVLPNPRLELSRSTDVAFRNEGEYTGAVGFNQQFPVAGRLLREKNVARVDIALAENEVVEAERRLAGEVATNVYRILVINQQMQSRTDLIAVEEKLAKTTRDRYKAAEVSELDVNTVKLDLQRLAQEQSLLENQRHTASIALNTFVGRSVDAELVIEEPSPDATPLQSLKQLQILPDAA